MIDCVFGDVYFFMFDDITHDTKQAVACRRMALKCDKPRLYGLDDSVGGFRHTDYVN